MQAKEYKVTLVGSTRSGKSSFLGAITNTARKFPTLGVTVAPLDIDRRHRLQFWDTAGDSRYTGLGPAAYATNSDLIVAFGGKPNWVKDDTPCIVVEPSDVDVLDRILHTLCIKVLSKL